MITQSMDRRTLLKVLGAGIGVTALAACGSAATSGSGSSGQPSSAPGASASGKKPAPGTVAWASANPLSGVYASAGLEAEKMGKLLISKKYTSPVSGHRLSFESLDTQGQSDQAQRVVSNALNQGVKYFFGGVSSDVALAMSQAIHAGGGMFVTTAGADEITGSSCNSSTIRWSTPTYGAIRETVIPLIKKNPQFKKWYAITPNYVFGQSLLNNLKQVLPQHGARLIGNSFHSLSETQFSSYISSALSANPDVLVLLNFSSQNTATIKQALSFGAQKKLTILSVWAEGLPQFEALGASAMDGLYFGCQYWHGIQTPTNAEFVKFTQAQLHQPPDYSMSAAWVGAQLLVEGLKNAKSTSPADVIKALDGHEYAGLTGTEKVRSDNHQVEKEYYLLKGNKTSQMKDKYDYVSIISSGKSYRPVGKTGCHM